MLSPAVMFIEGAIESLKTVPDFIAKSQRDELNSLGPVRAQAAGATGLTDDFAAGYMLGLQTARTVLQGSAVLAMKGVKPSDLL